MKNEEMCVCSEKSFPSTNAVIFQTLRQKESGKVSGPTVVIYVRGYKSCTALSLGVPH
jgi:hypothetical protein